MASLVLSLDGEIVREFEINKPRFTIGRRPYNDVPIDNLAISGEHAAIVQIGNDLILEDGGSTNGTLLNGTQVEKQLLKDGDVIEISKYHLRYFAGKGHATQPQLEKTMLIRSPFAGKQLDPAVSPAHDNRLSADRSPHPPGRFSRHLLARRKPARARTAVGASGACRRRTPRATAPLRAKSTQWQASRHGNPPHQTAHLDRQKRRASSHDHPPPARLLSQPRTR